MMNSDMNNDGTRAANEPSEIEALLPWYAAGTLRRRDRSRVEEALRNDPDLARHADLVREELAETIYLNESLGVPSVGAMDRLMAAIDDETVKRKRASPSAVGARFGSLIASLSPRTLAFAASIAVAAIALQAFLLVGQFTKSSSAPYVTASDNTASRGHGSYAMVKFAREASAAEITRFLEDYKATLVDGPKPGGFYRVRIAMTSMAKEELSRIVSRMRQDRVVETANPGEGENDQN
jgi:anti-sigma-K factor RskA